MILELDRQGIILAVGRVQTNDQLFSWRPKMICTTAAKIPVRMLVLLLLSVAQRYKTSLSGC